MGVNRRGAVGTPGWPGRVEFDWAGWARQRHGISWQGIAMAMAMAMARQDRRVD